MSAGRRQLWSPSEIPPEREYVVTLYVTEEGSPVARRYFVHATRPMEAVQIATARATTRGYEWMPTGVLLPGIFFSTAGGADDTFGGEARVEEALVEIPGQPAVTIRDQLAMAALGVSRPDSWAPEMWAARAYVVADAMLVARDAKTKASR